MKNRRCARTNCKNPILPIGRLNDSVSIQSKSALFCRRFHSTVLYKKPSVKAAYHVIDAMRQAILRMCKNEKLKNADRFIDPSAFFLIKNNIVVLILIQNYLFFLLRIIYISNLELLYILIQKKNYLVSNRNGEKSKVAK